MNRKHYKKIVLLFVILLGFLVSCNSFAPFGTNETTTTNQSTNSSSMTTYEDFSNSIYNLNSNELNGYLQNIDTTDPVIAASIVIPSVVELTVDIEFSYTSTYLSPFGTSTRTTTDTVTSQATGFFINDNGYLVTNAHVVSLPDYEGYPDFQYISRDIKFSFADDDQVYNAQIVDYDSTLDLAILQSNTVFTNVTPLTFFGIDSNQNVSLYYGESVIAVGNANAYGISVTSGIISAPVRFFQDGSNMVQAIQTDAAINEGNSGGPLTNLYGAVVGINSFKIVTSTSESLGYAIPANVVMDYLDSHGISYSVTTDRAYLSTTN